MFLMFFWDFALAPYLRAWYAYILSIFLKFDIMKDRKEIGGAFTATFNRGLPQSDNLSIKPENHQKD